MHISQILSDNEKSGIPAFSLEFFPPKTTSGIDNLYHRIESQFLNSFPSFVDVTWHNGGGSAGLTVDMVSVIQGQYGLNTLMHLTCTDMGEAKIKEALESAYKAGCTNILALRGDPPRDKEKWVATDDGFLYARDLVKYIRKSYGDYFDIGVAGYPEGCDDQDDPELLLEHLKEKVDAGATFIVTQMFYDVDGFCEWQNKVRAKGITVPIVPGIMPISTYTSFLRRCNHMNARIPSKWTEALEPVKNDDAAVREIGKGLVAEMCRTLLANGINHLHFYTMNLAQATKMVLKELKMLPSSERPSKGALPWRQSLGLGRRAEDVRPIFWRNRNKSYVMRTQDWDEFPNGRWGDSRSPAYGELDAYGIGLRGTNEQNRKLWGEPKSIEDIAKVFVSYLERKIETLPWSEAGISDEADIIKKDLIDLNLRGLLTINSQPAVDGAKSTHPIYGWGPKNGYVYQKAYLELLVSPDLIDELIARICKDPDLTYYAVTQSGELRTNASADGPNAVTWGVFPGKEIVQPTIVETISFLAWKDEAFRLGTDWSKCHDASSPSRYLIDNMMQTWSLVNIVHNDFHQSHSIFPLFQGLQAKDLDKTYEAIPVSTSGYTNGEIPIGSNPEHLTNGH